MRLRRRKSESRAPKNGGSTRAEGAAVAAAAPSPVAAAPYGSRWTVRAPSKRRLRCAYGGVPERPNGAVLKNADRRKAVRGVKPPPRRCSRRIPRALSAIPIELCGTRRSTTLLTFSPRSDTSKGRIVVRPAAWPVAFPLPTECRRHRGAHRGQFDARTQFELSLVHKRCSAHLYTVLSACALAAEPESPATPQLAT